MNSAIRTMKVLPLSIFLSLLVFSNPAHADVTGTRNVSFTYDAAGRVLTQTVEPGASDPSQTTETDYTYDTFGNVVSVTVKGCVWTSPTVCSPTTRTASSTYDSSGQFPVTNTNALNQSETWTHDPGTGKPTSRTGPNGLTTSWSYDGFGRATLETRPDGNKTALQYIAWTSPSWPEITFYTVETPYASNGTTQNGPIVEVSYDALSRAVLKQVQHFSGSQWIDYYLQYDALGRVARTARPYFQVGGTEPSGPAAFTNYTYDALGRVTQAAFPDGSHSTYTYQGLTSSATNDKGQSTVTTNNAQGLPGVITDAAGHATLYAYDAFGDLAAVTDPENNTTLNTYDAIGRKIASSDPDMGNWTYKYDSFGELASQTDAKNQTTTLSYDALGRVVQRSEPGLVSNWTYDTAAHGIGLLASACTGSGCTSPGDSSYFRSQTYDSLGRPAGVTLTIGGTSYSYAATYDANGRPATLSYPSGFVTQYVYTPTQGYLSQIKDNGTGTAYWTVNSRDAEMHALQVTTGNSVVTNQIFDANTGLLQQIKAGTSAAPTSLGTWSYAFDTIGNLTSRSDTYENYTENFCYDALNRLTNYAKGASCTAAGTKTVGYDVLGNITSKSDAGTYVYGAGAGPHAVTSIAGTVNGASNPIYAYDANGNMTSGGGRTVTYTAFNMADTITQGTTSDAFTYDSEHNRVTSTLTGVGTTTYLNALGGMSEKLVSGSNTTWHDYIVADGQLVAEKFSGATTTVDYLVTDHLGSVHLITDATGTVTERLSYDAWGLRRNPDGSDAASCTAVTSATTRGFTGQEHIDPLCTINFNARLYDPIIGRFMSADSIVPNPMSGQSFNRYSYVENGPLSANDPTGHAAGDDCQQSVCNKCKDGCGGGSNPSLSPQEKATLNTPSYAPCYGCFGPGWEDGGNGYMIPTGSLAFYTGTVTQNGQAVAAFKFRGGQWASAIFGAAQMTGGVGAITVNMPGLSNFVFGFANSENAPGCAEYCGGGQFTLTADSSVEAAAKAPPYNLTNDDLQSIHMKATLQVEAAHAALAAISLIAQKFDLELLSGAIDVQDNFTAISTDHAIENRYNALVIERMNQIDDAIAFQKLIERGYAIPIGPGAYYDPGGPGPD